jgi:hypothetical protein
MQKYLKTVWTPRHLQVDYWRRRVHSIQLFTTQALSTVALTEHHAFMASQYAQFAQLFDGAVSVGRELL